MLYGKMAGLDAFHETRAARTKHLFETRAAAQRMVT
jgi:hypothetical protein